MKNKTDHVNNVKRIIGKADGWQGVQGSTDEISNTYLLIPKFLFPKVYLSENNRGTLSRINEFTSGGNPEDMRKMAYEYLAMADYIDTKKEQEGLKLKEAQFAAYNHLFPYQNLYDTIDDFNYATLDLKVSERRAIDEIVRLKSQIDNP